MNNYKKLKLLIQRYTINEHLFNTVIKNRIFKIINHVNITTVIYIILYSEHSINYYRKRLSLLHNILIYIYQQDVQNKNNKYQNIINSQFIYMPISKLRLIDLMLFEFDDYIYTNYWIINNNDEVIHYYHNLFYLLIKHSDTNAHIYNTVVSNNFYMQNMYPYILHNYSFSELIELKNKNIQYRPYRELILNTKKYFKTIIHTSAISTIQSSTSIIDIIYRLFKNNELNSAIKKLLQLTWTLQCNNYRPGLLIIYQIWIEHPYSSFISECDSYAIISHGMNTRPYNVPYDFSIPSLIEYSLKHINEKFYI